MDGNEINEAFGYTPPTAEATTASEATANASEATTGGQDNAGSSAQTAEVKAEAATLNGGPQPEAAQSAAPASGDAAAVHQTEDDNHRYAVARRQAEAQRDRAIAEERKRSEQYANDIVSSLGIVNPYTGTLVKTKPEYDSLQQKTAANTKQAFMTQYQLDEAQYNQIIGQLPEVIAAQKAKAEAERVKSQAQEAEAKVNVDTQLKEVTALDPSIKSLEDLMAMDTYKQFYEYVRKGNNFADAYRLANYNKMIEKSAASVKQKTLNEQAGKAHLASNTANQGAQLPVVPKDVLDTYRYLNPDMSDEDVSRDFAKRKIK